jgi:hypothetical protein
MPTRVCLTVKLITLQAVIAFDKEGATAAQVQLLVRPYDY